MRGEIENLAHAMGWQVSAGLEDVFAVRPNESHARRFDPFTDANDDYAVLEWMRSNDVERWELISEGCEYCINYEIGDYARAALSLVVKRELEDG